MTKRPELIVTVPAGADAYRFVSDELARHGGSWEISEEFITAKGERAYKCLEIFFRQSLDPTVVAHDEG
jgi:hypothetical protein